MNCLRSFTHLYMNNSLRFCKNLSKLWWIELCINFSILWIKLHEMQKWFLLSIIWYNKSFSDLYISFVLFFNDSLSLLIITSRIFHNFKFFWYSFCKHFLNFSDNSIIVAVYFMFLFRMLMNLISSEKASLDNYKSASKIKYIFSDLWKICKWKFWIYYDAYINHKFNLLIEMIFRNICLNILTIMKWSVYTITLCFEISIKYLIFFSIQIKQINNRWLKHFQNNNIR